MMQNWFDSLIEFTVEQLFLVLRIVITCHKLWFERAMFFDFFHFLLPSDFFYKFVFLFVQLNPSLIESSSRISKTIIILNIAKTRS